MSDLENYLLSAFFFLLLCGCFYLWKIKKKNSGNSQRKFVLDTLELASSQFEPFNIRLKGEGAPKNGLSAMLNSVVSDGLRMEVNDYVSEDWRGREVEVFFRARSEDGPVFYTFTSVIKKISADYESSQILLAMPENLRVEKKRHFLRVQPQKNDVRVIGVWRLEPGQRLPRSTSEMGSPLTHYKPGMATEPVKLENISASGLALRLLLNKDGKPPFEISEGSQLLCLVVYVLEESESKTVAFWCTGEVMNSRIAEGSHPALVVGLEYTNWAVLEQGAGEIHWAHSSPSRGARPILQWVEQIDKKHGQTA